MAAIEEALGNWMMTTDNESQVLVLPSDKLVGLSAKHPMGHAQPPVLLTLQETEALQKALGKAAAKLRVAAAHV